ncbi:unnamed protein product, partial [Discosporangium mesarthrocarpum]
GEEGTGVGNNAGHESRLLRAVARGMMGLTIDVSTASGDSRQTLTPAKLNDAQMEAAVEAAAGDAASSLSKVPTGTCFRKGVRGGGEKSATQDRQGREPATREQGGAPELPVSSPRAVGMPGGDGSGPSKRFNVISPPPEPSPRLVLHSKGNGTSQENLRQQQEHQHQRQLLRQAEGELEVATGEERGPGLNPTGKPGQGQGQEPRMEVQPEMEPEPEPDVDLVLEREWEQGKKPEKPVLLPFEPEREAAAESMKVAGEVEGSSEAEKETGEEEGGERGGQGSTSGTAAEMEEDKPKVEEEKHPIAQTQYHFQAPTKRPLSLIPGRSRAHLIEGRPRSMVPVTGGAAAWSRFLKSQVEGELAANGISAAPDDPGGDRGGGGGRSGSPEGPDRG